MVVNYKEMNKALKEIKKDELVLIGGHLNPDMDSICSSLALAKYLNKIGINANVLLEEKYFIDMKWFKNNSLLISDIDVDNEYFIMVDSNTKSRLGIYEKYYDKAKITYQIDHHENNEGISNYILCVSEISSTCEMVYNIMDRELIDKEIAELLYAGIVTDTKNFTQRVTSNTFLIASKLLEYNIDYKHIVFNTNLKMTLYESNALAKALSNVNKKDKLSYVIIDKKDKEYSGLSYNFFAKRIAPLLQNIEDIDILLVILKDGEKTNINIRSNCNLEVAPLAKKLGGGGHKFGAGATIYNKTIEEIIDIVKEYMNKFI